MFAPIASETRNPFNASSEIRAWSRAPGEAGGDEHRADFVAVETGCVGFVVEAWSTNMNRW